MNATVFLEDPFVILGSMEEAEMRFDGGGISCRKALSVFEYFFWGDTPATKLFLVCCF